jgi:hypothetical protein
MFRIRGIELVTVVEGFKWRVISVFLMVAAFSGSFNRLWTSSDCGVHITLTILDVIHLPVFYLKDIVSEAGFCLPSSRVKYSNGPNRESWSVSKHQQHQ